MDRSNILALGSDGKLCLAYMSRGKIITRPVPGDINTVSGSERFSKEVYDIIQINKITTIVSDLHPDHVTTALADRIVEQFKKISRIRMPHHFAHIASCMYEHAISGKVIGVAFDGTGYGPDGNSWGGEFIVADRRAFKRATHLKYVFQPGGDRAAKEVWRMGLGYLYDAFPGKIKHIDIPFIERMDKPILDFTVSMMEKKVNCPLTSSAGRLFDAVAAITCVRSDAVKEAEAAIALERECDSNIKTGYNFKLTGDVIDMASVIRQIVWDIKQRTTVSVIAAKFHNTIGEMIFDMAIELKQKTGIKRVVLSGGVFQNKYLTDYINRKFENSDMMLFKHRAVPATDAGICLGQLWSVSGGYGGE